jgi:hypothetical protein
MAAGLLLEFDGVGREQYEAVNARLGIDPATGEGDWPHGLLVHAGGAKPGSRVVMEVWESQQARGHFMEDRLPAGPIARRLLLIARKAAPSRRSAMTLARRPFRAYRRRLGRASNQAEAEAWPSKTGVARLGPRIRTYSERSPDAPSRGRSSAARASGR